jgi:hypothetical protein
MRGSQVYSSHNKGRLSLRWENAWPLSRARGGGRRPTSGVLALRGVRPVLHTTLDRLGEL